MFRAPICRQSATRATASTSPGESTSVQMARPVSARASARISRPSSPSPRNAYGEERGLNAPPRRTVAPAARSGHDGEWRAAANGNAVDRDHRVLGDHLARCELERPTHRHDLRDARERLDRLGRGTRGRPERTDGDALRARQWHRLDAELLDARDDRVDLLLRRAALHDDEHYAFSFASPGVSTAHAGRSERAPCRNAWRTSRCERFVFHAMRTRTHLPSAPGTGISCPQMSGTSLHPMPARAASAGNAASRSGVTVNQI